MKKLTTFADKHPITRIDFDWLSAASFDFIKRFCHALPEAIPITGLAYYVNLESISIGSTITTIGDGWIVWGDGEPLYYEAQSLTYDSTKVLYWQKYQYTHPLDPIEYEGGVSHNVHTENRIKLIQVTAGSEPSDIIAPGSLRTLKNVIQDIVGNRNDDLTMTAASSFSLNTSCISRLIQETYGNSRYELRIEGSVIATAGVSTGWKSLGTLTLGVGLSVPTFTKSYMYLSGYMDHSGVITPCVLRLSNSGSNYLLEANIPAALVVNDIIHFDGLRVDI